MQKNIILCSDGTGNRGGTTPDTNIFKIYNWIDIHSDNEQTIQVAFYDNGVGTSNFNPIKKISGAFGLGFKQNVIELYCRLAETYDPGPGDKIFLFGFSRGAATVRAFSGFLDHCGLLDGRKLDPDELESAVEALFYRYINRTEGAQVPEAVKGKHHGQINVEFIGVWDTVEALGAPRRTEAFGLLAFIAGAFFTALDWLINYFISHRAYNYALSDRVINAYQALAIDDERTSFWPVVWDEHTTRNNSDSKNNVTVEQVWFSGMHSDVGGGYHRSELSDISLDWMMKRAERHGLRFEAGAQEKVERGINARGLLHDSRSGAALFYRYHPRDIQSLCTNDDTIADINIHESVIERAGIRSTDYHPTGIPKAFNVVSSALDSEIKSITIDNPDWDTERKRSDEGITSSKKLYNWMMSGVAALLLITVYFWRSDIGPEQRSGFFGWLADIFTYMLPKMFDNVVEMGVARHPIWLILLIMIGIFMFTRWKNLSKSIFKATRASRKILLAEVEKNNAA